MIPLAGGTPRRSRTRLLVASAVVGVVPAGVWANNTSAYTEPSSEPELAHRGLGQTFSTSKSSRTTRDDPEGLMPADRLAALPEARDRTQEAGSDSDEGHPGRSPQRWWITGLVVEHRSHKIGKAGGVVVE